MTEEVAEEPTFVKELAKLINKYSLENASNTPDFILASYLENCLTDFNHASRARERWFGRSLEINYEQSRGYQGNGPDHP